MGTLPSTICCTALLVVSCFFPACNFYYSTPCEAADRFEPLRSNYLMEHYANEPNVRYLLTRMDGSQDTLTFKTRLDTLFVHSDTSELVRWCESCDALYEIVQIHFDHDSSYFDMEVACSPCNSKEAVINSRNYPIHYGIGSSWYFEEDTLRINDSMGLYYYTRDSQYQLMLLP